MSIEIPPGRKLSEMTQVELCALVDAHIEKYGPPVESYDEKKNTYFGWTDDGKGVSRTFGDCTQAWDSVRL